VSTKKALRNYHGNVTGWIGAERRKPEQPVCRTPFRRLNVRFAAEGSEYPDMAVELA
jgi:hypothetical protein